MSPAPPDGELVTFADGSTTLGTAPLMSGTATFSTSSLAIGDHTITATYMGDANYLGSASNSGAAVAINQATPTNVRVNPVTLTYGMALANSQLSGTATWTVGGSQVSVPGTFIYTSAAGTVLSASSTAYTENVTFSPNDTTDYTTASTTVEVTVNKATPANVTVNPVTLTYGTALANSQLTGAASWTVGGSQVSVPGTFTYTTAAGAVLNASSTAYTENVTFTPGSTTDYTTASTTVSNGEQGHPVITWSSPASHHLRHGPERHPAGRHGQRARHIRIHPGRWHGPERPAHRPFR